MRFDTDINEEPLYGIQIKDTNQFLQSAGKDEKGRNQYEFAAGIARACLWEKEDAVKLVTKMGWENVIIAKIYKSSVDKFYIGQKVIYFEGKLTYPTQVYAINHHMCTTYIIEAEFGNDRDTYIGFEGVDEGLLPEGKKYLSVFENSLIEDPKQN